MDDTEDDARYPPKHYSVNHHRTYNSSQRSKLPLRNASYPQAIGNQYDDEEDDEQEADGFDEDEEERGIGDNEEEDDDGDDDDDEDDQYDYLERHPKKRKLKNLASDYEFAPRATAATNLTAGSSRKPSFVGRNSPADWTEHATSVLLEAWGDRYLQLGRKSLRSDDWTEVAEKVSEVSKVERTDTQCRNRLDTLKKKYKKEKAKVDEIGGGGGSSSSKWVYFKKMDMLMAVSPRQNCGLACGVDSGEYVFMNPKVYLNCSNGLDEMRDSPANSESCEGDEDDDLDGIPQRGTTRNGAGDDEGSSFRLLADSVQKFGEIYEKIENTKRQQMMELEKMRMDFHRELELQKKQILERAQAEIEKIRQGDDDDDDTDASAENLSE
ncbi:hypothetical protein L1049_001031 [Liquidambar formosana]|uniref:Myb/SANT-like DNA-binding domain-containing protein n=1 Tax=Liquidambar formosana TaxID=63359 RepID=A0AAP0NBK9_LIQFO